MIRAALRLLPFVFVGVSAQAKVFQNSYVSFEVPDNWTCLQEGVAWSCTPSGAVESKEAVIVLAAKVAGPEDNLANFLSFLKQPKKITTRVGTPMPSQVMYAQPRLVGEQKWVQAQHLGSEIQEYYTLYLATVKDQLAILLSFSAESGHYQVYNPIFDKAVRTLKIVATQKLLSPRGAGAGEAIGIQVPAAPTALPGEDYLPPPTMTRRTTKGSLILVGLAVAAAIGGIAYIFTTRRKKISHRKKAKPRSK